MVQSATGRIEQLLDSGVLIEGKALDIFVSSEITGDGTAQSTVHSRKDADGKDRIPTIVWTEVTEIGTALAGPLTIVQGTHTTTNVIVTATTGIKYKVLAI